MLNELGVDDIVINFISFCLRAPAGGLGFDVQIAIISHIKCGQESNCTIQAIRFNERKTTGV